MEVSCIFLHLFVTPYSATYDGTLSAFASRSLDPGGQLKGFQNWSVLIYQGFVVVEAELEHLRRY